MELAAENKKRKRDDVTTNHVHWTETGASGRLSPVAQPPVMEGNTRAHVLVTTLHASGVDWNACSAGTVKRGVTSNDKLRNATQPHVQLMAIGDNGPVSRNVPSVAAPASLPNT